MAIKLTKKDIDWIQKKYPKLKRKSDILWQGEVNFNREFNGVPIKSSYLLEIKFESKQGSILPQVKELGGKFDEISKELNLPIIDLHINHDKTICLCIYKKEKGYFTNGFSVQVFFENILEPYLYWITHYQRYKTQPWGGYAHGEFGYLELYAENEISISELKEYISIEKLLKYKKMKGHHPCLCGSKKILRKCHVLIYNAIYKLKKELYE